MTDAALIEAVKRLPSPWFSAGEIASMGLPGYEVGRRRINGIAREQNWANRRDERGMALARLRKGRGGAIEYHACLLAAPALEELLRVLGAAPPVPSVSSAPIGVNPQAPDLTLFHQLFALLAPEDKRRLLLDLSAEEIFAR